MKNILYVLAGFISGIFGGMGMGGGTVLIPALTLLFFVEQKQAQGINLIVFLPTALIGTLIYAKKGFLDKKALFLVLIPALISAFIASTLLNGLEQGFIKTAFGWFLTVFGAIFLVLSLKKS